MRAFDWVIYAGLLAGILWVVFGQASNTAAPAPPPAHFDFDTVLAPTEDSMVRIESAGRPLPPVSAFDPEVRVELDETVTPGTGTAFSIDDGIWMTARHVVDGCDQVGLLIAERQGILAREISLSGNADLAILDAPLEREPLALDLNDRELSLGDYGYFIGYPQGRPGEVAARLLGRETLLIRGRYATREPVIAWAETSRTRGLSDDFGGISGGPAFDDDGEVVGVAVAQAPRRGRLYSAAPSSLRRALKTDFREQNKSAATAGEIAPDSYGDTARRLRRSLQVAKVVCVTK